MHSNVKRFIVASLTFGAAWAWGYESSIVLGVGTIQALTSILIGVIIGIVGSLIYVRI